MRILVTGSRTWNDEGTIIKALLPYRAYGNVLVVGGAKGADTIAEDIWVGVWGLTAEVHLPDWNRYGRSAGLVRNREMIESGVDVCLAFIKDNSRGASFTAGLAIEYGIELKRYNL